MPYFAEKLFVPLNKGVRVVAISTTSYVPRINLNLSGSLDSNGTALPSAGGTPLTSVIARDNPNVIAVTSNSAASVRVGHYSTNGGSTFTAHPTSNSFCVGSAISDNGQFILFANSSAPSVMYYTYNGGSTWSTKNANNVCGSVCCSSDGTKVFMSPTSTGYSQASISTNSMGTLSTVTMPATGWYGCCMTGDGSRIWVARYANVSNKLVYYSDNNGSSWTSVVVDSTITSNHPQFIKCSKDGKHLIVGGLNANIYVSNNFGATWTKKTMTENVYGLSVNISSSGRYMVVVSTVTNGRFFYSKDFGATWSTKTVSASTTQFRCIAIEEQTS
jgi:hypothetical protein